MTETSFNKYSISNKPQKIKVLERQDQLLPSLRPAQRFFFALYQDK